MRKLLLAHGDGKVIQMLQPELARHFSLDSATDGLSAVRQLKRYQPEVIVADYYLPLVSGLSFLKFVRSQPEFYSIPFLFLTRHPEAGEALGSGASDWINPAETAPEQLIAKIYQHLKLNRYPYGL